MEDLISSLAASIWGIRQGCCKETQETKHKSMEWSHMPRQGRLGYHHHCRSIRGIRRECCMRLRKQNISSMEWESHMLATEDLAISQCSIDLGNKTRMLRHETQEAKQKFIKWSHIYSLLTNLGMTDVACDL
ncbi:hypothetical protein AVEN_183183-1 [Araneus ventricosus]|uniref:Uncharacterized protein n=1 Tax=Araneus ventricosus TaxID=182803 RepID=A0A4Y2AXJ8_ARAVE|nr:hypothetical protein AVEN_183183-1 [Araneus ventricosus]